MPLDQSLIQKILETADSDPSELSTENLVQTLPNQCGPTRGGSLCFMYSGWWNRIAIAFFAEQNILVKISRDFGIRVWFGNSCHKLGLSNVKTF